MWRLIFKLFINVFLIGIIFQNTKIIILEKKYKYKNTGSYNKINTLKGLVFSDIYFYFNVIFL